MEPKKRRRRKGQPETREHLMKRVRALILSYLAETDVTARHAIKQRLLEIYPLCDDLILNYYEQHPEETAQWKR